ncbi:zinc ribbon domain-containing protein [Staphylococcus delphini]|uniref:zinc ribbon domain-containing protein n=1 Tax=Staphylococcus delphini TaxID=53344 RepID=UPI0033651756
MVYCTKCGNALKENQPFCNRCGQPVAARSAVYVESKKSSPWPWIIGIIGVLILLAGLAFAGLQIFKNNSANQSASQTQNGANTPNSEQVLGHAPRAETSVNVLTDSFSADFMNTPSVGGYNGFNVGMTRSQIEQVAGQSTGTVQLYDSTVIQKYNNMGVEYDSNDRVSKVYVTPDNVTTQQFTNFHGGPKIGGGSPMLYDNNPNNGFSIYAHVRDGYVVAIENGPQYQFGR